MTDNVDSSNILGSGGPKLIVVMGVSGCGKSTTGQNLGRALNATFVDGDDLHPAANVAKMSRGEPLTDADRAPWLKLIRERATELSTQGNGVTVVACSSLRKAYRELLRGKPVELVKPEPDSSDVPVVHPKGEAPGVGDKADVDVHIANTSPPLKTYFVFIKGTRESLFERMQKRQGHFMKASMLESQLTTLESPEGEDGVIVVDLEATPEQQCEQAVAGLKSLGS